MAGVLGAAGGLTVAGGLAVAGVLPDDFTPAPAVPTVNALPLRCRAPGLGVSGSTSSTAGLMVWDLVVSTEGMLVLALVCESEVVLELDLVGASGGGIGVLALGVSFFGVSAEASGSLAVPSPARPPAGEEDVAASEDATVEASVLTFGRRYEGMTKPGFSDCCATFFGGHSRLSFASSFRESATELVWDTTLELRDDADIADWETRLVWFSNLLMRLAMLPRGDSSGRGLAR